MASSDFTLTGTVHTNAGTYVADAWSFSDPSGNYASQSGTVTDSIGRETPTVNVTDMGGTQATPPVAYPATAKVTGVPVDGTIANTTPPSPILNSSELSFTYYDNTTSTSMGSTAPTLEGNYTATATYTPLASVSGSSNYTTATGTTTFNINMGVVATSTSLTSSNRWVVYGKTVTFTAVVTAKTGTPTGSVEFVDESTGNTTLGVANTASRTTSTTSTWTFTTSTTTFNVTSGDTIEAMYVGSGGFEDSDNTVTQTVTKATLTITAVKETKVYDGTNNGTATGTPTVAGLVGSDSVTWTTGPTEYFNNKNVGGKSLSVNSTGYVVSDPGNYTERLFTASGTITALPITVTAVSWTKVYDGTTKATGATPTITLPTGVTANANGVVGTDTPDFTETYSSSGVGTGLTLTPAGSVNDGNSGHNYTVKLFQKNTTGAITTMPGVIDNSGPGFAAAGTWKSWTTQGNWTYPGYLGNDVEAPYQTSVSPTAPATGSATWTYTNAGSATDHYTVYVTWPACSNRATNVPYTVSVYNSSGNQVGTTATFIVDQKNALTTNGQPTGTPNPLLNSPQTTAVQVANSNPTGTGAWTWVQLGGSGAYQIPAGGWLVVGVSNAGRARPVASPIRWKRTRCISRTRRARRGQERQRSGQGERLGRRGCPCPGGGCGVRRDGSAAGWKQCGQDCRERVGRLVAAVRRGVGALRLATLGGSALPRRGRQRPAAVARARAVPRAFERGRGCPCDPANRGA